MKLSPDYTRMAAYNNEVHYLSKYLGGRNLDIANHLYEFFEWRGSHSVLEEVGIEREELEKAQEEGGDEFYAICDQILAAMNDREKEDFVGYFAYTYPTEAPAWAHMSLEKARLPRKTWLVHFSDQTGRIIEEGFTRGVDEMEKVAYTNWLNGNAKKYGGYNFAFVAGDRDSRGAAHSGKYGKSAVMFQSSGLEVYHYGDEEKQVIYWGKVIDPKTVVELVRDGDAWAVAPRYKSSMAQKGRDYAYRGEFTDVVNWVERHWFQYRNQIMGK